MLFDQTLQGTQKKERGTIAAALSHTNKKKLRPNNVYLFLLFNQKFHPALPVHGRRAELLNSSFCHREDLLPWHSPFLKHP